MAVLEAKRLAANTLAVKNDLFIGLLLVKN
jgi:hypothetical protein